MREIERDSRWPNAPDISITYKLNGQTNSCNSCSCANRSINLKERKRNQRRLLKIRYGDCVVCDYVGVCVGG